MSHGVGGHVTERNLQLITIKITAVRILPSVVAGVYSSARRSARVVGGGASGWSCSGQVRKAWHRGAFAAVKPEASSRVLLAARLLRDGLGLAQDEPAGSGEEAEASTPFPWALLPASSRLCVSSPTGRRSNMVTPRAAALKPSNVTRLTCGLFHVPKDHGKRPFCFCILPL